MDRVYLHIVVSLAVTIGTASCALAQGFNNQFDNPLPSTGQENVAAFSNEPVSAGSPSAIEMARAPDEEAASAPKQEPSPANIAIKSNAVGGNTQSLVGILGDAGPMAIPIACCSVLLVMFVLERAFSLRRRRVIPKHFVRLFLTELEEGQLKPQEALEQCEENQSPIAEVFAAAVKKWNRPAVEVEQAVIDAGERVANELRRYLRLFNGIATISPLLGLLGTVLGMIRAFNAIAASDAMGKPELLAEGIGQALLTTAGGLSAAIPAFIAYMYFSSRVDRLIIEIDGFGQQVVSAIANDSWKDNRSKSKKAA